MRPLDETADKTVVPGMGQLPAGSTTSQLQAWASDAFGPGAPLRPTWIDPRDPRTGQPDPRLTQYPVGVNLQIEGERRVPFETLRSVADDVDLIRQCIKVRKSHMCALDWCVTISERTMKRIIQDDKVSAGDAAKIARERYAPDIARVEAFWMKPDRMNDLAFPEWLSALLEEMFVIDATTIYPHANRGGAMHSFELIDGATIKPLRNNRGGRPAPPAPAFQQILHGFPRGQWTAAANPDGVVEGGMQAGELVYRPRDRRTYTPYGYSYVEQAISIADVYLKRTHWIRSEFTEGSMPESMFETDAVDWSPEQLLQFETALNDLMAGNTAERKKIRLLPKGMKPVQVDDFAKRYSADFDEFLVKMMCACFDVLPTEIGFPPSSGIGGKGHSEGEESATYRRDYRPTAVWLNALFTDLSVGYLAMPPELEFKFLGYEIEDQKQVAEQHDIELRNGSRTLNDVKALRGEALYDFVEADTPFIVTGAGIQFMPGALEAAAAAQEAALGVAPAPDAIAEQTEPAEPAAVEVPDGHVAISAHTRKKPQLVVVEAVEEGQKFLRYARKRQGGEWRPFAFESVDEVTAELLNSAGELGRIDLAKTIVGELGKASAPKGADRLAGALRDVFAGPKTIADAWIAVRAATKATAEDVLAAKALIAQHTGDPDAVIEELLDLYGDAFADELEEICDELAIDGVDPADPDSAVGVRWATLAAGAAAFAVELIASKAGQLSTTLVENGDENVEAALTADLDDDEWPTSWADHAEQDAAMKAVAGACTQAGVALVRIVADPDECEFCQQYDGRLLSPDTDQGLPPLHRNCACSIEPVEGNNDDDD